MAQNPLQPMENLDPELMKQMRASQQMALADGALPRKYKLLIAMALDASKGAAGGVGGLCRQAMQAGATKQEVAEALRVTYYICGGGSVHTAAQGLKEIF
ncbi:MAG: carboxymuconolactone decarboxylase family protein [Chloroflexota bacterium]